LFEILASEKDMANSKWSPNFIRYLDTFNKPKFCLQIHVLNVFEDTESIFYVYVIIPVVKIKSFKIEKLIPLGF